MLIPVIRVRNNNTGYSHIVGSNTHDALVSDGNVIWYFSHQGGTTREGDEKTHEFDMFRPDVDYLDPYIEFVTLEEWIKLSEQDIDDNIRRAVEMYQYFVEDRNDQLEEIREHFGISVDTSGDVME